MRRARTPDFLPLTADAAVLAGAHGVLLRTYETDSAAGACWTALLAGCENAARWGLAPRLRLLSEATSEFVGTRWWSTAGACHRNRVAGAQGVIEDALAEGDGGEFARAFVDYDNAMASAVVCGRQQETENRTR